MTLADWLAESRDRVRYEGLSTGGYASAQELWAGALGRVGELWNYGESVHEREWDVLLVFDACRVDLMATVARTGEYDLLDGFDPERDAMNSVASRSPEWIAETFDPDRWGERLADVAYVTANPHSREVPDPDALARVDEVWRYGWDDERGVVPPRTMTDRTVATARAHDGPVVAHYMQPHLPFRSLVDDHPEWFSLEATPDGDDPDGAGAPFKTLWRRLRDGEVSREVVWEAYVDNLRWVLDEVATLRSNLDGTAVVTADHANAMGEWWCYGHQTPAPVPAMKRVPWVSFEATDERTFEPTVAADGTDPDDDEVRDRLRNLGYV
ncbi:hypothetical protein [Candidatus Halobonum tyrrellensis]|uniref:Sulfatase N-terminal domain-containing protein n=1 Tax=Candidatus Halobonum tyrrellensis G22 TaxID=1324957 RepID=V4HEB1_9EURY|nr:hypothetical protein [Candidatus Halobonum tyrrellensis]ESP89030.1 hypothetical protein K933_06258 [Candidatus Halobonum tyrrellensis G22]